MNHKKPEYDIALIHPPYIFHENKYPIFPLPWSLGHIGSTSFVGKYPIGQNWQAMPIGFFTMKNFIERNSRYSVTMVNLASLKSSIPCDIFERYRSIHDQDRSILSDFADALYARQVFFLIKNLKARLFAVDLHWVNYSHGAIRILELLKEMHPASYTVIGGFTASYFKKEIMDSYPFIDFLVSGDGAYPLLQLIKQIKTRKDFSAIPNLMYRKEGAVVSGPRRSLNDFHCIESDPAQNSVITSSRGCSLQCIACGGSRYASKKISRYSKPKVYSIDSIMAKLFDATKHHKETMQLYLVHDPFVTLGRKRWETLLDEIKRNRLPVSFLVEFFLPHSKKDIITIAEKIPGSSVHISPESIDYTVRTFQKNLSYSNQDLVMNMDVINDIDSLSMGVWFMAGLAKDSAHSVKATLSFVENYYRRLRTEHNNFIYYNELLFIDPGSLAFDFPEKYGYRIINKTFASLRESFALPLFKYQINYRTKYHTQDELFAMFLQVHNVMNRIYRNNGIIDAQFYSRVELYNRLLKKYSVCYDKAIGESEGAVREQFFKEIGGRFRQDMAGSFQMQVQKPKKT